MLCMGCCRYEDDDGRLCFQILSTFVATMAATTKP